MADHLYFFRGVENGEQSLVAFATPEEARKAADKRTRQTGEEYFVAESLSHTDPRNDREKGHVGWCPHVAPVVAAAVVTIPALV